MGHDGAGLSEPERRGDEGGFSMSAGGDTLTGSGCGTLGGDGDRIGMECFEVLVVIGVAYDVELVLR